MFCTRTGVQGLILYKYNQCTMPKIIGTFVLGDDFQCQQAQDVQVPNGLMFTATSALCFTFIWTVNMVSSWKVTYAFRHHDCIMLVPLSDCHQLDYILHKSMVIIAASLRHATQYEFGRHCVPFSPLSFHFLLTLKYVVLLLRETSFPNDAKIIAISNQILLQILVIKSMLEKQGH